MSKRSNDLYATLEEILPIVEDNIAPILRQVKRELALVVDYVPGRPVRVRLSKNRKFVDRMRGAIDITDPKAAHTKRKATETNGKKAPISRLKITFPDGSFILEDTAANTFFKFVHRVGAERVRSLGIVRCKIPLVSSTIDKKYKSAQKSLGKDLYLNTHSNTKAKIEDIRKIAEAFNIELKVEAVDKFAKDKIGAIPLTGL